MRRLISLMPALFLLLSLTACFASPADPDTVQEDIQFVAMDTAMRISAYGKQRAAAVHAAEERIRNLEARLSRTAANSELSRLNAAEGHAVEAGPELAELLTAAERYRDATGGAFDVTVAPVASAWGFTEDRFRVPDQSELEELLKKVDGSAVRVEKTADGGWTAALAPGQAVDLGGIAKGYAADKLVDLLRAYEIPRAMISLGGNVLAWGGRPDGTPWRIGLQDPARPGEQDAFAGILNLENAFAVTSGGYQRYFEENRKRYHHIIDPATGYPADSGLTSVTVVAGCTDGPDLPGTMCDALSTALFILGEPSALDFRNSWNGVLFELVLITEDGRVVITQGLAKSFTLEEGSGYTLEVVS